MCVCFALFVFAMCFVCPQVACLSKLSIRSLATLVGVLQRVYTLFQYCDMLYSYLGIYLHFSGYFTIKSLARFTHPFSHFYIVFVLLMLVLVLNIAEILLTGRLAIIDQSNNISQLTNSTNCFGSAVQSTYSSNIRKIGSGDSSQGSTPSC